VKDSTIALVLACVAYIIGFIHGLAAMMAANWDNLNPEPDDHGDDDEPFDDDPDGPDPLRTEADIPSIMLTSTGDVVIDDLNWVRERETVMSDFHQADGLYSDVSYDKGSKTHDS